MADPIPSTPLSRRTMLAGGLAAPILAFPLATGPMPAAALIRSALVASYCHADAPLLAAITHAQALRQRHARACRLRRRLSEVRLARIGVTASGASGPTPAAWLHDFATFEPYAAAVRAAVAVPAHTVAGIHAKLALAIIAARRGPARIYMYEDREWLEAVLGDLARLAAAERQSSPNPLAGLPRDRQFG